MFDWQVDLNRWWYWYCFVSIDVYRSAIENGSSTVQVVNRDSDGMCVGLLIESISRQWEATL